jgi:type I restriction enzyme, S subunit
MTADPLGSHLVQETAEAGERWRELPLLGLSNEGKIIERREVIGQKTAHKCRIVEPGDIVFNPIRFSIGSIARYRGTKPAIVSPEYQVLSTRATLSSELLVRYLRSRLGRSTLETETTGSVRYRIYFKDLEKIEIPLAPPEDQAKAERVLGHLAGLSDEIQEIGRMLDVLDRSLLAKAFRGELVPQDPNDEPAETMLARVRASGPTDERTKGRSKRVRGATRELGSRR